MIFRTPGEDTRFTASLSPHPARVVDVNRQQNADPGSAFSLAIFPEERSYHDYALCSSGKIANENVQRPFVRGKCFFKNLVFLHVAHILGVLEVHLFRGLGDFLPMLVRSSLKEGVVAGQPEVPRQDITHDGFVGVSAMWPSVGVVDRGRQISGRKEWWAFLEKEF